MKPSVAITLILCGSFLGALPIVGTLLGVEIRDVGFACYLALAGGMVTCAIVGSFARAHRHESRGFEPVPNKLEVL